MRKVLGPLLGLLLAIAVGLVAYLNQAAVTLDLWFQTLTVPLWMLIGGLFLLGILTGIFFLLPGGQTNRERIGLLGIERDDARNEKEEAAKDARRESESERMKQHAEIEGLHAQVSSLEEQIKSVLSTVDVPPRPSSSHEGGDEGRSSLSSSKPLSSYEDQETDTQVSSRHESNTQESTPTDASALDSATHESSISASSVDEHHTKDSTTAEENGFENSRTQDSDTFIVPSQSQSMPHTEAQAEPEETLDEERVQTEEGPLEEYMGPETRTESKERDSSTPISEEDEIN